MNAQAYEATLTDAIDQINRMIESNEVLIEQSRRIVAAARAAWESDTDGPTRSRAEARVVY